MLWNTGVHSRISHKRRQIRGGGFSIYINETWNYKLRSDLNLNNDDIQMIWIEIDKDSTNSKSNTVIGTIYRRPGSDPNDFNNKLNDVLSTITRERKCCLHSGD